MSFLKRNLPIFITGSALLVVFFIVIGFSQTQDSEIPTLRTVEKTDLIAPHTYVLGYRDAPLEVVIFSDLMQEPEKALLKEALEIQNENSRFVSLAIRPALAENETNGDTREKGNTIAKTLQISGEEGFFQGFITVLTETDLTSETARETLDTMVVIAESIGIPQRQFKLKIQEEGYDKIIAADYRDAKNLDINSTPAIFINEEKMSFTTAEALKEYLLERISLLGNRNTSQRGTTQMPNTAEPAQEEVRELTMDQRRRLEETAEIGFEPDQGWAPERKSVVKGQLVRWTNNSDETIFLRPLDKIYEGLRDLVEIGPGESFEYRFPKGGLFRYEEKGSYEWGLIIVEW